MSPERAQGRGWVRIPASRVEPAAEPGPPGALQGYTRPPGPPPGHPYPPGPPPGYPYPAAAPPGYPYPSADRDPDGQPPVYLSLVRRWREAGLTLPGHPDEEWERLISQPCWPGH